jgi:hypothetical protein
MTKTIIIVIISLIIIVGVSYMIYQYFIAPTVKKVPEETKKLTLKALKDAEYYVIMKEQEIKLTNGSYKSTSERLGLPESIKITDKVAFGDITNDGKEDAAVILATSLGGSGTFYQLSIMINQDGKPYNITNTDLGDVIINSISIHSGEIMIDMIAHSPGDAMCCPTLKKVVKYRLSGDKLLEL